MRRAALTIVMLAGLVTPGLARPPTAGAGTCTYDFSPADAPTIPTIIGAGGTGRVFCFSPGTYAMSDVIKPHANDQLIGAGSGPTGTILRGAKTISGWTLQNGLYVRTGDAVSLPHSGICYGGGTTCQYPDWLFANGVAQTRVLSPCTPTNVTSGRFCIDYSADKMYLFDDPAGRTIEYSFVPQAVGNAQVTHVTLRAMQFTKFANGANAGGIVIVGPSWLVDDVDVNKAHTCGISMPGSGALIENSRFHLNGQFGFCSSGGAVGAQFVNNEVDYNNTLGFDGNSGAGGGKFVGTLSLVFSGNNVHHNNGTGIWMDNDTKGATITNNISSNNTAIYDGGDGIKLEVSCFLTVGQNTVSSNARNGIYVQNSHDSLIELNTISTPAVATGGGMRIVGSSRAGSNPNCGAENDARNDTVRNNAITMGTIIKNGNNVNGVANTGGLTSGSTFAADSYAMPSGCAVTKWKWVVGTQTKSVTFAAWQSYGQDVTGTCA